LFAQSGGHLCVSDELLEDADGRPHVGAELREVVGHVPECLGQRRHLQRQLLNLRGVGGGGRRDTTYFLSPRDQAATHSPRAVIHPKPLIEPQLGGGIQ